MKISVIVPVYNVEGYVEECIRSVLNQTEADLEIIAVNDASTDGSWEVVRKLAAEDSRIILLENERNMGLASTRNAGLARAKGDYVYFLDSDDMIEESSLGILYERAVKEDLQIQIFAAEFIYENDSLREKFSGNPRVFKGSYPDVMDGRTLIKKWMEVWDWLPSQPRYFYKREFLIRNNLTYRAGMVHEDEVFSMNAIMAADRIRVTNDEFFIRRFRASSIMTGNVTEASIDGCRQILENTQRFIDFEKDEELQSALRFYEHKIEKNMQGKLESLYKDTDEIIKVFEDESIKLVSFDMFDTLFVRPVESPADVYRLLDKKFREVMENAPDFLMIRTEAEAILRRNIIDNADKLPEDFDISRIYGAMHEVMGIPENVCSVMLREETALEKKLLKVRETGRFLLKKALEKGKRVIITSDMYMTKEFIRELLSENGMDDVSEIYVSSESGKRKISGSLYKYIIETEGVGAENILHIGDNSEADCLIPAKLGIRTCYLPNTADIYRKYECDREVKRLCGGFINYEAASGSVGFKAMRKMASNMYFDDPFRSFNPESVYNNDPYFCGYAALGPELLALTKWIIENVKRDDVKRMIFLSRDGYLPKTAYDMAGLNGKLPPSDYIYVSRLSLLPVMIRTKFDLYELPVDKSYQTPEKLIKLLDFCIRRDKGVDELIQISESYGIPKDKSFTDRSFKEFIRIFADNMYDEEVHRASKERVKSYLKDKITDNCAIFDMGYSGRIAAAIAEATGTKPKVYFFHSDSGGHFRYEEMAGIEIRSFLDFNPHMESSLREYSYLEAAPSCIGYDDEKKPHFDIGTAPGYERTVIPQQKGALDFVRAFTDCFSDFEKQAGFRYMEASLFFEAFIRYASEADKAMYDGILIDDELWGGRRDIDLKDLMNIRLRKIPDYAK